MKINKDVELILSSSEIAGLEQVYAPEKTTTKTDVIKKVKAYRMSVNFLKDLASNYPELERVCKYFTLYIYIKNKKYTQG